MSATPGAWPQDLARHSHPESTSRLWNERRPAHSKGDSKIAARHSGARLGHRTNSDFGSYVNLAETTYLPRVLGQSAGLLGQVSSPCKGAAGHNWRNRPA
jgi:hypothetical protein